MKTLLIMLVLMVQAPAFYVSLVWNHPNPVGESVQHYVIRSNGAYVTQTSSMGIILLLPNTSQPTPVTVSAVNSEGESLPSNVLLIPPPLVSIERSTDFVTWTHYTNIEFRNNQILRLRVTPREGAPPVVDLEQKSDNVTAWVWVTELPYSPTQFVRMAIPPSP